MRFQALMPDILHWLGIKKIDRMLSMSKWVTLLILDGFKRPPLFHLRSSNLLTRCAIKYEARCYCWPRVSHTIELMKRFGSF